MNLLEKIVGRILRYTIARILVFQEKFNMRVRRAPDPSEDMPDHFKTLEMCNKAVEAGPCLLKFVPTHFRTHCLKIVEKQKAQKASTKEELMPIAWHPSHWWDWCVAEDEKHETKKLWG